jgi:hypothetical protein
MTTIEAVALTSAPAPAVWKLWTDIEGSPTWDVDVAWSRLHGDFAAGTRGELALKSGLRLSYVIDEVVEGQSYTNTVRFLPGLTVRFRHVHERVSATGYRVRHSADVGGPLGRLLVPLLRLPLQSALSRALGNLVRVAERRAA